MIITMDIFLQIWGGVFYLLNKIFFAISEGKSDSKSNRIRISGWLVYILGVPPWVIILVSNQDWIAASIEAGGLPAMILGLYVSLFRHRKPGKHIYHLVTLVTYAALSFGVGLSIKEHGGLTSFTQILEIGVMFGFLLSGYNIAKNNPVGWLFFMLGNICMAGLMYIQNAPILMAQQLLSLCFVVYGFSHVNALNYRKGAMKKEQYVETVEDRMHKYDRWVKEGKIPFSSKVIPVQQSLSTLQWVLPTQQMVEILKNSRSFALANCMCREKNKRCDHPLEVCIYTNDVADQKVEKGAARRVSLQEATEALKLANMHGLIHLTIYNPDQHVFALCSCCECCCHDIEFMKKFGRPDLVAHADYIAVVDTDACVQCGECVERCVFDAQVGEPGAVSFHQEKCYGCGLCITTCESSAIQMKLKVES